MLYGGPLLFVSMIRIQRWRKPKIMHKLAIEPRSTSPRLNGLPTQHCLYLRHSMQSRCYMSIEKSYVWKTPLPA